MYCQDSQFRDMLGTCIRKADPIVFRVFDADVTNVVRPLSKAIHGQSRKFKWAIHCDTLIKM